MDAEGDARPAAPPTTPRYEGSDRLDPAARTAAVARLRGTSVQEPLDVLVIGGGVVGAGAALDAAARGLTVGLVEMHDLAAGTSSRSSRLAHGGLRYLEQREFALVHEALTERGLLLDRIAPHLAKPVPLLFPVTRRGWERPYVGAGIHFYDMLSRIGAYGGAMPRPKTLSKVQALGLAPDLREDALVGAVRFYDAQIDDARHTVAVARSAAARGAAVVTRTKVVGLLREGERVVGALLHDHETGETYEVHARAFVGAAGVWTDAVRSLLGDQGTAEVRQSKGVHLVVPRQAFRSTTALMTRTPTSVLFVLPWGRHWLIGTTDTDWDGDLAEPSVDVDDVEYLLDQANRWMARPLTHADVMGVYAGLRPLLNLGPADGGTATLSREHGIVRPAPGIVLIAGGKYTTYRVMAADVVDAAVKELAELGMHGIPESSTADIPLVGAEGYAEMWTGRAAIADESGVDVASVEHLLRRHGDRTPDVLDLIADDPSLGLPLHPDEAYLRAEVVVAATHEGARGLSDVLVRRLRVALETRDSAVTVARDAAELMAPVLGWDHDRVMTEIEAFAAGRPLLPAARDLDEV